MGDPLFHSQSSANKFGGVPEDYLHIHTVMDSSKLFLADWRHRALLHNTFGIHVFEQLLGASFCRKSDNVAVCTRSVISQHIMEDINSIPTPGEFLREMPVKRWMAGMSKTEKATMQALTIEGNSNKEAYIQSNILWNLASNQLPLHDDYYLVSFQGTSATSCVKFVASSKCWLNSSGRTLTSIEYWAALPMGPIEN